MNAATAPLRVLMVDDEPNVLAGYRRTLGRAFPVSVAEGGAAGLAAMDAEGPFAVVVTDMRMPGMTGTEFLAAARARSRDAVFLMLTGNADQQTAADAINQANVFRFLTKPCPPDQLEKSVRDGVRQYEMAAAERALLRDTFAGSIKLLVDALELSNPKVFACQSLVRQAHQEVCAGLGLHRDWQLGVSATLCLVGLVAVPEAQGAEHLSNESVAMAAMIGSQLLQHIPRLGPVAEMILHQRDDGMLPDDPQAVVAGEPLQLLGARLLRFCVDLSREQRRLGGRTAALAKLSASGKYDRRLIDTLRLVRPTAAPAPAVAGRPAFGAPKAA